MKKIEYNRDIKRKWMLLVICFLALLIIIFGCQSSKLKRVDKVPPVIELYSDTVEITEGDEYNPNDNVKSVKDNVDGDIIRVDKVPPETGIAYYFIDSSNFDISKAGEYSVKVSAKDKAENESIKEFIVKVNARNDESSSSSSAAGSNSTSGSKDNTNSSVKNNKTSNSNNKENTSSENNNSETSSNNKSQQTCKIVHHDATGHNEQYLIKNAWIEEKWVGIQCITCGAIFYNDDDWVNHSLESNHGNCKELYEHISHPAEYGTKWVEDSASWNETICN